MRTHIFQPGDTCDDYQIKRLLGAGGFAEVYAAVNVKDGQAVALKCLQLRHSDNRHVVERMKAEAELLATANHPNLVEVLDFGKYRDVVYMAMELLRGETLRDVLTRRADDLSVSWSLFLGCEIADGLSAAHERGVVHRDLKPDNVFLTHDNQVKVLDLGAGKFFGWGLSSTVPGYVIGTPLYMAPEHALGEIVDARTDVYSLGVMLYEMIAGHPYQRMLDQGASKAEILARLLHYQPPTLRELHPDMPATISSVVAKAMARKPEDRFASMRELARGLRGAIRAWDEAVRSCNPQMLPGTLFVKERGALLVPMEPAEIAAAMAGNFKDGEVSDSGPVEVATGEQAKRREREPAGAKVLPFQPRRDKKDDASDPDEITTEKKAAARALLDSDLVQTTKMSVEPEPPLARWGGGTQRLSVEEAERAARVDPRVPAEPAGEGSEPAASKRKQRKLIVEPADPRATPSGFGGRRALRSGRGRKKMERQAEAVRNKVQEMPSPMASSSEAFRPAVAPPPPLAPPRPSGPPRSVFERAGDDVREAALAKMADAFSPRAPSRPPVQPARAALWWVLAIGAVVAFFLGIALGHTPLFRPSSEVSAAPSAAARASSVVPTAAIAVRSAARAVMSPVGPSDATPAASSSSTVSAMARAVVSADSSADSSVKTPVSAASATAKAPRSAAPRKPPPKNSGPTFLFE